MDSRWNGWCRANSPMKNNYLYAVLLLHHLIKNNAIKQSNYSFHFLWTYLAVQRITVPNWLPPGGRCFLLDLGLTAWNTALACIKFSMYWPRTEFSDRNLRFSSFTASTRLVRSSRVFWSSKTYNSWIWIWIISDIAYISLYYYV